MTFWEEQMAHEPTRAYYEKLKEIIKSMIGYLTEDESPAQILEIGLDVGISARAFLEFPDIKLTSVDCGDVEGGIKNIKDWGLADRWTFVPKSSDQFFAENKNSYDVIYIDGDHSYQQTKKDIDNAWKFVKLGGILIGHDFLHKNNFRQDTDYGVTQAFREFICEQNVEAHIYPPHPGLIVIRK